MVFDPPTKEQLTVCYSCGGHIERRVVERREGAEWHGAIFALPIRPVANGVDWPFWTEDGLSPSGRPELSDRLNAEVLAWAADFNDGYSWEPGWPTEAAARIHERQANRLLQAVERELDPEDLVSLHYWETNRRKGL